MADVSVAIIGAGPRGIEVLERVVANHTAAAGRADDTLAVHVVDPYPPGGGKVWRSDQSPLLRLNSMACDVTLFTDHTVTCAGPIRPGPSLAEWAAIVARDELADDALRAEADALVAITFPTRRLGGEYLAWAYRRVLADAAADGTVRIVEHAATAVDVFDAVEGAQRVELDDGRSFAVDAVVMTLGHLDVEPAGESAGVAELASRHGLAYLPPAYGTEADLSVFRAGENVIVRGFGLGFVDLLVLLTEARGGRYVELGDGRLRYEPSGNEPRFHIGSRRGVPYRTKLTYELRGPRPTALRFFTRASIEAMLAAHDVVDFRAHAWPLIAKEVAWAAYHELALGHEGRISGEWADFDSALEAVDWGTPEWDDVVTAFVPAAEDRVDFDGLDRPLDGLRFHDVDALQDHLRDHVRADVARRADPHFSADLGAFNAFLAVFANLPFVLGSPKMSAKSRVQDFDDWWFGFFSYFASGPPPQRMQELLALSEAGIVTFLGAETWVRCDEDAGAFVGGSTSSPATVTARALMDARLPGPSVHGSTSALVQALAGRGVISELSLREPDGTPVTTGQIRVSYPDQRVLDRDGMPHPRLFAVGPHSTSKAPAFVRPHTNALALRHNDACARAVLNAIAGGDTVASGRAPDTTGAPA
jgi:hypothetical protein